MTGLALSLLLCLVVGAMVDRALLGGPGRGAIENLGRCLALGIGSVGVLSLLVDGVGLGVSIYTVGGSALVLVLILAPWAFRKKDTSSAAAPIVSPRIRVINFFLLLIAAVALAFTIYSGWLRPCYQFDALVRWMFKAKALAVDGTLLGALSMDEAFNNTHQRYPPLVSHVANLPFLFSGRFDDRIASAIFPWYAVALVCLVYGALKRTTGRLQAAIAAAWIASLPIIAFRDGSAPVGVPPGAGAFSALADIPLALFVTGAAMAAMDGVEGRRKRAFLEAGLMLGFATLTKNEGLPLVAGVVLAVLICSAKSRWRSAVLVASIALVLFALLWGRIALSLPALDENYPGRLNIQAFMDGLDRLPLILARLVMEIFFFPSWNLTWIGIIGLLILSGRGALDRAGRLLLIIAVFQLAVYVLAFTITAWTSPAAKMISRSSESVPYLMNLTTGRLLLHVVPLCVVAALRAAPLFRSRPEPVPQKTASLEEGGPS